MRHLLEGGVYSREAFIQGRRLFEYLNYQLLLMLLSVCSNDVFKLYDCHCSTTHMVIMNIRPYLYQCQLDLHLECRTLKEIGFELNDLGSACNKCFPAKT